MEELAAMDLPGGRELMMMMIRNRTLPQRPV